MLNESFLHNLRLKFQPFKKKVLKQSQRGLGVYENNSIVYIYYTSPSLYSKYNVATSPDGFNFELKKMNLSIDGGDGLTAQISTLSEFNISSIPNKSHEFNLLFKADRNNVSKIFTSHSYDLFHFRKCKIINSITEPASIVQGYVHQGKTYMYFGSHDINIAVSENHINWIPDEEPVLTPRSQRFDKNDIEIESTFVIDKGILVLYHNKYHNGTNTDYAVGAALFDKNNPKQLLWRSNHAIWTSTKEWRGKQVRPVGVLLFQGKFISYWDVEGIGIFAVVYSFYKLHIPTITNHVSLNLERSETNPMLSPQDHKHWESFNVFNPATVYEAGKVHILYRAQGYNYVSTFGYATSKDGVTIDERSEKPIFTTKHHLGIAHHTEPNFDPFSSGGGFGGCEDPRITKIDDKFYMIYVANDGYLPRLALTSISVEDFLAQKWLWKKPVMISPPGVVDKSGCILPEKINGKYVIFHRIFPNILIDYVESLDFKGYDWLKGKHKIEVRKEKWDSLKIGTGAPPLKTKDGWLMIYYAVDEKDSSRYKIGAMLLDLNDPTKVLHRTDAPILEPTTRYENEGFKPGIAYPCGAVIIKNTLFVYYGGADSVVCVATANLNHFLSELKYSEMAKLDPAIIKQVL